MTESRTTPRISRRALVVLTAAMIATASLTPRASLNLSFDGGKLIDSTNREIGYDLGDFNEDGYADVITANDNGTVSLLINRTDNWFFAAPGSPISVGGINPKVVAGDFNADNHLDAAIVALNTNTVYVLHGDGAGALTLSGTYATGSGPFDVATADVNGDGTLDLVTANQANTVPIGAPSVSVLLGVGDGTFTAASPRDITVGSAGALARGVAIGDVTGEGDPDIVIALSNANQVSILAGAGDGTFTLSPTSYATTGGPRKVVLGDFDENGSLDIATADSGDGVPFNPANKNNKTTVLLNDGAGAFSPAAGSPFTTGPAASAPFAIRTADLDGDGHLDLVFVNRFNASLSTLRGSGDGTFAAPVMLAYPEFDGSGAEATDVVVGDINADGKPDVLGNAAGGPGFLVSFTNTTTIDPPILLATTPASPGNVGNPTVSGTVGGNTQTVTLYTSGGCLGSAVGAGTAAQFEGAGIPVSVAADATSTFFATTTNAAGWATSACSSTSVSYTYDATPPAAPADLAATPASASNDNSPKLLGSAEAGSTIRIYATADCTGSPAAIDTAANFASPGITVTVSDDSTTTFTATATDAAGNTSSCSSGASYTEDSTPPSAPSIDSASPPSPANDNNPELIGTAEAGSTIMIYASVDCSGSAAATASAANFAAPGITLTVGDDTSTAFTATATDAAGNTSTCSSGFTYTEDSTANPPFVIGATTFVNVQTTSGLVILPNFGDAAGVTHFRISNIFFGTLFQTDGVTSIPDGGYITLAEGASGLKFTPAPGSSVTGGFDVQAALGETLTGISTPSHAGIAVNKYGTTTTILSDDPDPSDQSQLTRVAFSVASVDGGPAPTGTVRVQMQLVGGETCFTTVAAGYCDILLTTVGVDRIITVIYDGDVTSLGSSATAPHTVTACTPNGVVTSTADSGAGSLRQAMADACTDGSISFSLGAPATYEIFLASPLAIDKNLTITGPSNARVILDGSVVTQLMVIGPAAAPTLSRLTFSHGLGPAVSNSGQLTILESTLNSNIADGSAPGALFNDGTVTIRNSTFSSNITHAGSGGAIANAAGGDMTLLNVTATNNYAEVAGGAIYNAGTFAVKNSIVAGNSAMGDDDWVNDGTMIDLGNNLLSGEPMLAVLQDNGGPTPTHMPLPGSPAIDGGDNTAAAAAGLTTDQRGIGFARVLNGPDGDGIATVDIGAVEADPVVEAIAAQATNEDVPLAVPFNVGDAGTPFDSIVATSSNQTLVPDANLAIDGVGSTRMMTISPVADGHGTATITLTVTKTVAGATLSASHSFVLTVKAIPDAPVVTDAATKANDQTTSGLVITANAVDDEIRFFRITNVTNGTLFQNNGVSAIGDGEVIDVTQGNAGLRFTPVPGGTATGGFDVQGVTNSGVIGPTASATITVDKHTTTTTITSADPNPSDATQPIAVNFTVTSPDSGTTPNGPLTVTASGGSETCTASAVTGVCTLILTTPGINRTLTATYAGDAATLGSTGTALHTVNACDATTVVTSNADSGPGTLRQALLDTCFEGTISFDMTSVVSPIGLTSGELVLAKSVLIEGPGANQLTIQRTSGTFRILSVRPGTAVVIGGLTLANGDATTSVQGGGGAIYNDGGFLQIAASELVGNTANWGGAIYNDAAMNTSIVFMFATTLRDNIALHKGGAVFNLGGAAVGAVLVDTSTISGNAAGGDGGGLYSAGAGTLTLVFGSTITNNRADKESNGRGIGGGVWNDPAANPIVMFNTIVAGNFTGAGTDRDDISGTVNGAAAGPGLAASFNLIGVDTNLTLDNDGTNLVGSAGSPIDPRLGPLANNGGATLTHMLLPGSPALDAGGNDVLLTPFSCGCLDQRGPGFERIRTAAGGNASVPTADIGAVEADPTVAVIPSQATNEDASVSFAFAVGDASSAFASIVATSSDQTLMADAGLSVSGSGSTRTLGLTPVANQSGTATITVTATKLIAGAPVSGTSSFLLTVNAINDAPTLDAIADPAPISEEAGPQTIGLAGISAGGGEAQTLTVTASSSNTALVPDPAVTYTSPDATGSLSYTPVAGASGTAVITVTVHDDGGTAPGGVDTVTRTFTVVVGAVSDTPSITNATTVVNAQTTSGLVVSRNAADGVEVTHVQVTGITGGTLFKHDGVTPIANGSFITIAEGAAGLRFTPATDSAATGHVTIQASTSGLVAGLGGATVTADIIVNPLASTTTVVTSGSPSNPGESVTFTATVTPASPVPSGTVQFMDGVTALGSPVALASGTASLSTSALAAGAHAISAVYSGDALHAVSTGVLAGGQAVRTPVTLSIGSSANPAPFGSALTISATAVHAGSGVASGTMTFLEETTTLGTAPLSGGTASVTISSLVPGNRHLVVQYSGDAAFAPGSGTFDQAITCPVMTIGPSSIPAAALGTVYSVTFTQSGGGGAIAFTLSGALPAGLTFDPATATLSGMPAAPGSYPIQITATPDNGCSVVTASYTLTVTPGAEPLLAIDIPAAGRLAGGDFAVAGWALTLGNPAPPGVDAVHVWAAPADGGAWRFLGAAILGVPRPDVAIVFGSQYATAGYYLTVTGLPPGVWDLQVFPRATGTAAFAAARVVRVTVPAGAERSIITGADAGGGPHVKRFAALDGGPPAAGALSSFFAFDPSFTGGVRVAEGDVTGDGVPDSIAAAGPGAAPEVRIIDGALGVIRASFLAFEPEFRGGVFVAAADVNGDGVVDVIAGSGEGRRGEIKVFSGRDLSVLRDVFVFDPSFTGGVSVAAGDVNGDGYADLVAGAGAGGTEVLVLNATDLSTLWTVTPYAGFLGGAWVAAGDVTGDGFADIITGAGAGGGPHVRIYDGRTGVETRNFFAYEPEFGGGVRVAVGDVTGDGRADIITGSGPGRASEVRVFDATTAALLNNALAYGFTGGVFVATAAPVNRMAIDTPADGAIVHGPFAIGGWAFDDNLVDAGLDAIHVWAFPVAGGVPTFGGVATLGIPRPDVAALYGAQYANAGFAVDIAGLAPGVYDVVLFGHSAVSGTFNLQRVVRITVTP